MSFNKITIGDIVENLKEWAKNNKKLMIISHRSPDGDTLGSAFALKLIYEALGGYAQCTCKSEGAPFLRFLYEGQNFITYEEGLEKDFDKIVSVDVAAPGQLGDLIAIKDKIDIMIDHHERGEVFADNYVDGKASAAGEIIYKIYQQLLDEGSIESLPKACARIYAAISADTGSFKFSNVTPETHMIAAKMLSEMAKEGIDHSEIARILHDSYSEKDLQARKVAIDNLKVECDGAFAYVVLTKDILDKEELTDDNTGSVVDIPRSVEGVLVGISIKQNLERENEYRISARSNSDVDVAEICALFGGGGHKKAAGGRIEAENAEEAVKIITEPFRNAVMKHLEEKNVQKK